MNPENLTSLIKKTATDLGLPLCGMAHCVPLRAEKECLVRWVSEGQQAEMHYMANHVEKRTDPALLVPGALSVVSVAMPCYPPEEQHSGTPRIARYAFGKDYHLVLKEKLHLLLKRIREEAGPTEGRAFVDSAPVMERIWAARSGLGWIGKNGLLVNQTYGSHILLGELIINKELQYDTTVQNRCGSCTRCMEACPTKALTGPAQLDARRCISYMTIENKRPIDSYSLHGWMFGCDLCQEACPWNQRIPPCRETALFAIPEILSWAPEQWLGLTDETFRLIFRHSPLMRAGLEKLKSHLFKPDNG